MWNNPELLEMGLQEAASLKHMRCFGGKITDGAGMHSRDVPYRRYEWIVYALSGKPVHSYTRLI